MTAQSKVWGQNRFGTGRVVRARTGESGVPAAIGEARVGPQDPSAGCLSIELGGIRQDTLEERMAEPEPEG